jgi:hypothetical protein
MITRLSFPDVTSNKWGAPFSKGEFYTLQLFMLPILYNQILCVHYK